MDSSRSQASKKESQSFFYRSLIGNVERTKVINASFREGGSLNASLSGGKSAINRLMVSARRLRQVTHRRTIVFRAVLSLTMANCCCTNALKYSTPCWQWFLCKFLTKKRVTGWWMSSRIWFDVWRQNLKHRVFLFYLLLVVSLGVRWRGNFWRTTEWGVLQQVLFLCWKRFGLHSME